LDFARRAVADQPQSLAYCRTLATMLFRAGQHDEAIRRHEALLKEIGERPSAMLHQLVVGMAHHGANRPEQARPWLDGATRAIDTTAKEIPPGALAPAGMEVEDWVECLVLRREAERLRKK